MHWKRCTFDVKAEIPKALCGWMLYAGSFMDRLEAHGVTHARIHIVREAWERPEPAESARLHLPSRSIAFVREVIIESGDTQWMIARTVIPCKTLVGKYLQLARLKNRSLGSVLFKDPQIKRSEFEIAYLEEDQLWARRSIFSIKNKSLLLTEIFLPDMETI